VKIIRNRAFVKTIFLVFFISSIIIFTACSKDNDDEIPFYQEAIYIMDADGSNKTKVIDVDGCENVQFIPNSNKLLYLEAKSLYTVNLDGNNKQKISGNYIVLHDARVEIDKYGNYVYALAQLTEVSALNLFKFNVENYNAMQLSFSNNHVYNFSHSPVTENSFYVQKKDGTYTVRMIDEVNQKDSDLYTSENRISGIVCSQTSNKIFFIEITGRYKSNLYSLSVDSQELELITNDASKLRSYEMICNEKYIVFYSFSFNGIKAFDLDENTFYEIGNVYKPSLGNNDMIIYSNDFDSWGSIYLQIIGETETAQLASHGFCPSFSQDSTTIVYVGHYQTNKDVNYITN
jgi:hypothetical protein